MFELNENEESLWKKMFFLWERINVPEVRTKEFIVSRHIVRSPWFSLREKKQVSFEKKSINRTAKHLVMDLAGREKAELRAAYKIYTFLKNYYGEPTPFSRILIRIINRNGIDEGSLWFANAKGVIPYVKDFDPYKFEHEIENEDILSTVFSAAEMWIKFVEQWEIFIIPEYTARDSELNKRLEMFSDLWHKDEDFQKFIRLRDKLEKSLDKDFYKTLIKEKD